MTPHRPVAHQRGAPHTVFLLRSARLLVVLGEGAISYVSLVVAARQNLVRMRARREMR